MGMLITTNVKGFTEISSESLEMVKYISIQINDSDISDKSSQDRCLLEIALGTERIRRIIPGIVLIGELKSSGVSLHDNINTLAAFFDYINWNIENTESREFTAQLGYLCENWYGYLKSGLLLGYIPFIEQVQCLLDGVYGCIDYFNHRKNEILGIVKDNLKLHTAIKAADMSYFPHEFAATNNLTIEDEKHMSEMESNYFDPDFTASFKDSYNWHMHNPYTTIAVRSLRLGNIAGYLTILPVVDELFKSLLAGNCIETHLDISSIRRYDGPGQYKLYLVVVAIHPFYKNSNILKIIINGYAELFAYLAKRGILISELAAHAVTPEGEKFCRILGLKLLNTSASNIKVYHTSSFQTLFRLAKKPIRKILESLY